MYDFERLTNFIIGHFRGSPRPIKTRLSAQPNTTHFHKRGCALGFILKVRRLELGSGVAFYVSYDEGAFVRYRSNRMSSLAMSNAHKWY